jgi:lysozyme
MVDPLWHAAFYRPERRMAAPTSNRQRAGLTAVLTAAAVLAFPHIVRWEGLRTTPYRDIVGVATVCYGETRVPMRTYTVRECEAFANAALRDQFGRDIVRCAPGLADPARSHQLAATMLLTYNIGSAAFCRSTVARRFNAGDWRGGCDAFLMWERAGGRVVRGLVNRRRHERALCMTGV